MRKSALTVMPFILALVTGCSGKEADSINSVTTEAVEIATTGETEEEAVATSEEASTADSEQSEPEEFPGLDVSTYGGGDYREQNEYFKEALKAIAGLDFSSLQGADEIKEFSYSAELGDENDSTNGKKEWSLSILSKDGGFSDEFCNDLIKLVESEIPESTEEVCDVYYDSNNSKELVGLLNYEYDNAKVQVDIPWKNAYSFTISATVQDGGPIKKSEWVENSSDYNFNLMDTYADYQNGGKFSYAEHSAFVKAFVNDVFGMDLSEVLDIGEISSCEFTTVAPLYEEDDEYAQQWYFEMYPKDGTMFSDEMLSKFQKTCEEIADKAIHQTTSSDGIDEWEVDYSVQEGRIDASVTLSNDPGGKRKVTLPGGSKVDAEVTARGTITLNGKVNSDKYYEMAVD